MSSKKELKKTRREYIVVRTIAAATLAFFIAKPIALSGGAVAWLNSSEGRRGVPAFNNQSIKSYEANQTIFYSDGRIDEDEVIIPSGQRDYISYQSAWQEVLHDDEHNLRSFTQTADITGGLGTAINKNIYYELMIEDPSTLENFLRNSREVEQLIKVANIESYLAKEGVFSITSHDKTSDEMWIESRITSNQRVGDIVLMLLISFVPGFISFVGLSVNFNSNSNSNLRDRLWQTDFDDYKKAGKRLRELKKKEKDK